MIIETLLAVPAAGKTAAFLAHIAETGEKAIVASISRQLSRQSYDYFVGLGGYGTIIDTDNRKGEKSVNDAIIKATEHSDTIFITHAALLRMNDFDSLREFKLYIDEVPELVSFERFSFTSSLDGIIKYCDLTENGVLTLNEKHRSDVQCLASDGYKGKDDVHSALFPLYKALLTGIPARLVEGEKQSHCYFISDLSTDEWSKFESVTICAANIEQTFTGKILKHFNKWDFKPSHLNEKLIFKEYSNSSRVTINVMFDSQWSKHHADKEQDGITNYNRICNIVEGALDNFIYTRNSYRARLTKGIEVPYNPHGLNLYSNHTNVVVMFSYNPIPWQIPLLKELAKSINLSEDELIEAYNVSKYLEPAFQLCARCDIRNQRSNKPINLFVPDANLAYYMKKLYFKNAEISAQYMIENKKSTTRNRNSFQNLYKMDKKEKYKFAYLLRKLGRKLDVNSKEDQLIVQDWIIEQRAS